MNQEKKPKTGNLTVVLIFVFGGLFVAGLFWAANRGLSDEYKSSQWGYPKRTMRFAVATVGWDSKRIPEIARELRPLDADVVMLLSLSLKDAQDLAGRLEMKRDGRIQMYFSPTNQDEPSLPACAILSKWPLYQGRSMSHSAAFGFGIWAEVVVDGKRLLVGCADWSADAAIRREQVSAMRRDMEKMGRPPVVMNRMFDGEKELADPDRKKVAGSKAGVEWWEARGQ